MTKVKTKTKDPNHRPFLKAPQNKRKALIDTRLMSNGAVAQKYGVDDSCITRLKQENKEFLDKLDAEFLAKHSQDFYDIMQNGVVAVKAITAQATLNPDSLSPEAISFMSNALRYIVNPLLQKAGIHESRTRLDVNVNNNVNIVALMLQGEERLKEVAVKPAE